MGLGNLRFLSGFPILATFDVYTTLTLGTHHQKDIFQLTYQIFYQKKSKLVSALCTQ